MKVLVVGESCQDIFMYGEVKRLEPSAPVPVIKINNTIKNPGMAMNVAQNLLSLDVSYEIVTNSNWEYLTKTRIVEEKVNHMFLRVDQETTYMKLNRDSLKLSNYGAVIISDYDKGFLSKEDIQYICSHHPLVFLDTKKSIGKWCECATYIKINEAECKNADKITDSLKEKLIVTAGSKGAEHLGKTYPVQQCDIKDLSGAGDTFLAGLVANYIETKDMDRAIEFANECATRVVQKQGVSTIGN